jgi:peptidoglycan/LPS O-acetylase OafA/YrhL
MIFIDSLNINKIQRLKFRNDINGLRALAVLAVIFYHADFPFFKGGYLGVDIFFVISGFLISNIIISELNTNSFTFVNFYIRRIKRILPALFSTSLATLPFALFLFTPIGLLEYAKNLTASLFFYSNYFLKSLDFYNSEPARYKPLLHTWSLAIEEQFYIIFPVVIFIIYKYFRKYLFITIILGITISIFLNSTTSSIDKFYEIQFRAWELLLGVLVTELPKDKKSFHMEKIGFSIMLIPMFYFDDTVINTIEPRFISLLGAVLILLFNNDKTLITKLLSTRAMSYIGLISYSLYLFHQPVFAFYRVFARQNNLNENYLSSLLLICIVILLSAIQYKYIELKFLSKEKLVPSFLILPVFIFAIAQLIIFNNGITPQYQESYAKVEKYYSQEQRGGIEQFNCQSLQVQSYCKTYNQNENTEKIIVIGDSHLTTLSNYLFQNLDKSKFQVISSVPQGCPFFLEGGVSTRSKNCVSNEISEIIKEIDKNSTVIYGGRFPRYLNGFDFASEKGSIKDSVEQNINLMQDIETTLEFLSLNAKKVILIYPIPELGFYPLETKLNEAKFIDENEISLKYESIYWEEFSKEINIFFDNIYINNLSKLKTQDIFCNSLQDKYCVAEDDDIIYYWDDDHLSYDGAGLLGDKISIILNK